MLRNNSKSLGNPSCSQYTRVVVLVLVPVLDLYLSTIFKYWYWYLKLKYWYLHLYLRHGHGYWYCRLSVRQFVWKYWIDYWFVCGGCRIQFDRLSIVKHCCISDCMLCYVLSLTSNFVRAYMTQQHDTDYKYWYSGTGTWDSSTGIWMTEYWLQLCSIHGEVTGKMVDCFMCPIRLALLSSNICWYRQKIE